MLCIAEKIRVIPTMHRMTAVCERPGNREDNASERFGCSLEEAVEGALRDLAGELGLTRNDTIRFIVREWMEKNVYLPVHSPDEDDEVDEVSMIVKALRNQRPEGFQIIGTILSRFTFQSGKLVHHAEIGYRTSQGIHSQRNRRAEHSVLPNISLAASQKLLGRSCRGGLNCDIAFFVKIAKNSSDIPPKPAWFEMV